MNKTKSQPTVTETSAPAAPKPGAVAKGLALIGKVEKYWDTCASAYREARAEFQTAFDKNPTWAFQWKAETLMTRQAEYALGERITCIVRELPATATVDDVTAAIRKEMDSTVGGIIRFPANPSSTNAVANLSTLAENYAKCRYVRDLATMIGDFRYV